MRLSADSCPVQPLFTPFAQTRQIPDEVWNIGEVLAITAGTKESNTIRNFNTSGSAIHGVLSVPAAVGPAYYSSEAQFRSYIPNGGFTVPEPPE